MGLVIFAVMGLYLLVAIAIVLSAVSYAGKTNRSTVRWGLGAALLMYLIPFWDWLPTVAAHKYYCENEAGFWVYKTPEHWKKENAGVMETLATDKKVPSKRTGGEMSFTDIYVLNSRISWVVKEHRISNVLHVIQRKEEVIDTGKNQVLARYVDIRTGYPSGLAGISPQGAGIGAIKFWLVNSHCSGGNAYQDSLRNIMKSILGDSK